MSFIKTEVNIPQVQVYLTNVGYPVRVRWLTYTQKP